MPVKPAGMCAVDGGGTKTLAIVLDQDGIERGRAVTGPSNYAAGETERVVTNITAAVEAALTAAGTALSLTALWVGLAGIDRPGARAAIEAQLSHLAGDVRLTNDAQLLFGAFPDEAGIVIIAGTGSIALGLDYSGRRPRGGWRYLIGDEERLRPRATRSGPPPRRPMGADCKHRSCPRCWHIGISKNRCTSSIRSIASGTKPPLPIALVWYSMPPMPGIRWRRTSCKAARLSWRPLPARWSRRSRSRTLPSLVLAGSLLVERERYRHMLLERIDQQFDLGAVHIVDEPALMAARHLVRTHAS